MPQTIDLQSADAALLEQGAQLLVDGFRELWPAAWPDITSARDEIADAVAPDKLALGVVDHGALAGWIGGVDPYEGRVWELHPLVVGAEWRRRGIDSALVRALEHHVAARGAVTLWLSTGDETGQTSLFGVDLYPEPLHHLHAIRNLGGHPFTSYQRLGFAITGVVPDANGLGKPDIVMSKRVTGRGEG